RPHGPSRVDRRRPDRRDGLGLIAVLATAWPRAWREVRGVVGIADALRRKPGRREPALVDRCKAAVHAVEPTEALQADRIVRVAVGLRLRRSSDRPDANCKRCQGKSSHQSLLNGSSPVGDKSEITVLLRAL